MAQQNLAYYAFNRGLVSRLGLARADVKRLAMAGDIWVNWAPRVLGSMMVRPGLGYKGGIRNNAAAKMLPFIFSTSDKALIELTTLGLRVWVDDAVVTRAAVTTAVTDGGFLTNVSTNAAWADNDEGAAVSAWISAGNLGLTGTGTAAAIRDQQVVVAGANIGVEQALNITIGRGPVTLLVGSALGLDDYVTQTELDTGVHSLAFTPTGNFFIRFMSRLERLVIVQSCNVAGAGVMVLTTPWPEASLGMVRADQSGDIVYVACENYQQRKIERRGTTSWSVVIYAPEDGPFRVQNTGRTTLTPSVLNGNGTLTASVPTFKVGHVGALFQLVSTGQTVNAGLTLLNDVTASIRVIGVGTDRTITIVIAGITAARVITLQRSFDNSTWVDTTNTYGANGATAGADGLDNQIVYYRLKMTTLGGAGTTDATLSIPTGSITGTVRVTAFTNTTTVAIEVLMPLGATDPTDEWSEGRWSTYRGWPSAVGFYEGRLDWAGKDATTLSVSDGFESFDPTVEGDSAPIDRTIGSGPVDTINWILALNRLILGGQGAEFSCRSTSFDEPLTPTNFNIKKASRQGSAPVAALAVDDIGIFVQRGGIRVYALEFSGEKLDYASNHLTALVPEIGRPGIVRSAVQTQPDTRAHFVRSDGTVAMLVFDKIENVTCWVEVVSDGASGEIEDVVVLPSDEGEEEDHVYYVVKRTINGATVRNLERWATENECRGLDDDDQPGALCLIGDSYATHTGSLQTIITGLSHLEGEQVVVWADGADVGHDDADALIYTVAGGQITLETAATEVMVGLPYTAPWRSGKLVQLMDQLGTAAKQQKNIPTLGMILADCHAKGVKFGADFDNLDDLSSIEDGARVDPDEVHLELDGQPYVFPGDWTVDARLCLQGMAPRPCTLLALVAQVRF